MYSFEDLNNVYDEIEGIDLLSNQVGDDINLQRYVTGSIEDSQQHLIYTPEKEKKNRTHSDSDQYFKTLISKLSSELVRRGHYQEASDVECLALLESERFTERQYYASLRERWYNELLEYGLNKTNAKALSIMMLRVALSLV